MRNENLIFLFFRQNICCRYSEEPSLWDGSFEHPKHMLKLIGKKIFTILRWFLFCLSNPVCHRPPANTNYRVKRSKFRSIRREHSLICHWLVHMQYNVFCLPWLNGGSSNIWVFNCFYQRWVFGRSMVWFDFFRKISCLNFYLKVKKKVVAVFVFNVPPTAKVIWRRGHGLKSHPIDWWSQESNLRPLVYKASGLSTTPKRLLKKKVNIRNWYNHVSHLTRDTVLESNKNTKKHHTREPSV